jgi:hypothetical protein
MRLFFSYDKGHGFGGLTQVDLSHFFMSFLIYFQFQFHVSILDLLIIGLYNFVFNLFLMKLS